MVHNVALVLGAGGSAGQAWQIGVIAGLAEAGLDLTEAADLVIGTSSGATTAAWVRSGIPPAELFASVLSEPVRPAGHARERPPVRRWPRVRADEGHRRRRHLGRRSATCDGRVRVGERLRTRTRGGGQRRAMVAARLPRHVWPDRPMIVVALDAHTGELARSTAIPASTWWTRSPRPPRCPVGPPRTTSTAPATSTVACAPPTTPTSPRAMPTSWCSRRSANGAGHYRRASSRACADFRARTWQARSRPCASRAATSR
jgi:hypothetical protein